MRRAAEEMVDVLDEETALRTEFVVNLSEKVLIVLEALAPPTTKLTESSAVLDVQRRFQAEIDSGRDDAQDSVWRLGPDPPSRDRSMDALAGEGVVEIWNIMIRRKVRVDQRGNSGSEGMAHDLTTGTRSGQFPCQGMGRMGRTTGTGQELTTY